MNIYQELTQVFEEVFEEDDLELSSQMTANDVEGWDSMSHVNLMIAVELKFGIEFTEKEIRSFVNVGDLVNCIESKLG